ncbi:hypothetical protein CFC21_060218 [Triticum aestivum]|nr:cysteine proteinase inhibitor 8-like [Aegilops tauschii subsp. strangulata]XP_044377497.1 cysteine proteinase inhibitor 8-like [Triticum aestivum]KAF7052063.1 hypothetical protein CFC21_060218 [Triticum aestivum]
MAARPLLLLALLLATTALAVAATGRGGAEAVGMPGGWFPIPDVEDARIQELGGWAVARHAGLVAGDRGLRFGRVTRGEQQVVSGMNYRLLVDVADGSGRAAPYIVVVYEQSWTNTRRLTSFSPAACG